MKKLRRDKPTSSFESLSNDLFQMLFDRLRLKSLHLAMNNINSSELMPINVGAHCFHSSMCTESSLFESLQFPNPSDR